MQMELGCVGWKYTPNWSFINLQWTKDIFSTFFCLNQSQSGTKQYNILNGLYFNPSQPCFICIYSKQSHVSHYKMIFTPCYSFTRLFHLQQIIVTLFHLGWLTLSLLKDPGPSGKTASFASSHHELLFLPPKWDIIKQINKQHMYTYTNMFKTHHKGSEHVYSSYILEAFIYY